MKKLLVALLATFSLLITDVAFAQGDWVPPQIEMSNSATRNLVLIQDNSLRHSTEMWWNPEADKGSICLDAGNDLDCSTGAKGYISGQLILPHCGEVIESCIEKLWVYKTGSDPIEAKFLRTSQSVTFTGKPEIGLPSGAGVSVFEIKIDDLTDSQEFAVAPKVRVRIDKGKVMLDRVDVQVAKVAEAQQPKALANEVVSNCEGAYKLTKLTCTTYGGSFEGNSRCFFIEKGICALPQKFSDNLRIGVQLRLSTKVAGWFSGRLQNPSISVSKINSNYNLVKVDAEPVETPRFFADVDTAKGDPDINSLLKPGAKWGKDSIYTDTYATSEISPSLINLLRDKVNDTANGLSTFWNFYTTSAPEANQNSCMSDTSKVLGVVTTNAMAYMGTAPDFKDGFLQYKVAGLHYMPDGKTPVQGTYDLVMRSEVARCLYGFSSAPISATIEVTGGQDSQVATTTVKESAGWLKMSAYGFGFSNKTIKAKVNQKKIKGSITCVRGSTFKKVTAISPKCPAGYKTKY